MQPTKPVAQDPPLKELWSNLQKEPGFKVDYPTFEADMQDEENLRQLHSALTERHKDFQVDFDTFATDMGVSKKKAQTDGAASGTTARTGSVVANGQAPNQEFVEVAPGPALDVAMQAEEEGLRLKESAGVIDTASLRPGVLQAPGDDYAAAAVPLPSGEQLRADTEKKALADLAALPGTTNRDVRPVVDKNALGDLPDPIEYGMERVVIPKEHDAQVPDNTVTDPKTGLRYFDRPLSRMVDGKEQTPYESAKALVSNSLLSMVQGAVETAGAVDATMGYGAAMGQYDNGEKASAAIEAKKAKVSDLAAKQPFSIDHPETWAYKSAEYAPLVVAQVAQTLAPELRAPAAVSKAIGLVSTVGFDAQVMHGAAENAKKAGLKGREAALYTILEGSLTLAGFKAGSKLVGALGDKLAMKIAPAEAREAIALDATKTIAALEAKLGREATAAETKEILHGSLRKSMPGIMQIPKEMFQQAPVFSGVEGVKMAVNQVAAPALGGQADDLTLADVGNRLEGGFDAGLEMGAITGGLGAALGPGSLRPGERPVTEEATRPVEEVAPADGVAPVEVPETVAETPVEPAAIPADVLDFNAKLRENTPGALNLNARNAKPDSDNILYRPDRMYRNIGTGGYQDFVESGMVRPRQNTKRDFQEAYYSKGTTESRYSRGDGGNYVVEALPEGNWLSDDPGQQYYRSETPLTTNSKIRVFEKQGDGSFKVVFDNIGDEALLPVDAASLGVTPAEAPTAIPEQVQPDVADVTGQAPDSAPLEEQPTAIPDAEQLNAQETPLLDGGTIRNGEPEPEQPSIRGDNRASGLEAIEPQPVDEAVVGADAGRDGVDADAITDLPDTADRKSMARALADKEQPDAVKQGIRDAGLDKYEPTTHAATEAAVEDYMKRNTLQDAFETATLHADDMAGAVRTALRIRVQREYNTLLDKAVESGDTVAADDYLKKSLAVAKSLAMRGTEAGQEIDAFKELVRHSPDAAVYQVAKDVEKAAEKAAKTVVPKARKQLQAEKAKALDAALAAPGVKEAAAAVTEWAVKGDRPGKSAAAAARKADIAKVRATRASLWDQLKKLNGSVGIVPQTDKIAELHVEIFKTYIAEGVLQIKSLVARFRAEGGAAVQGASDNDLMERANTALKASLLEDMADNLADRVVAATKPKTPGIFDPVREMLDTLTAKVGETLPKAATSPKAARDALAHAINNRREYAKVMEEGKGKVLEKIAALKVSDEAKQKMVSAVNDFMDTVGGKPYAERQFRQAVRQAEDAVLAALPGKNRGEKLSALATLPEKEYERLVGEIQDHVTAKVEADDTESRELRDAVAEDVNQRVLARRRALRAKQGVYEEGQEPAPKAQPEKKTLSQRITALLAARATSQQVSERLAPEAIADGVKKMGTTLDQIARDHLNDHSDTGRTLAEAFVEEAGLTPEQAKPYAEAIEKEFESRIAVARQKRLDELNKRATATPAKRATQTDLDKTRELFTLSPTDDAAIIDHLKRTTKIPTLSVADVADLRALAKKVQQAPEGWQKDAAVGELLKAQAKIKGVDWLDISGSLFYANILSALKTHGVNLYANTAQVISEPLVSTVHGLIPGSKAFRGRYAANGVVGLGRGLARGAREAYSSFTTGREVSVEPGKYDVPSTLEYVVFKGGKLNPANYAKYVGRALRATDMLFSTGLREMRAYELATTEALADKKSGIPTPDVWAAVAEKLYRTKARIADAEQQAKAEGLTGNDYKRRVFEIAEQSRPVELVNEAREFGTRAVFNGQPKGLAATIANCAQGLADGVNIGGVKPLKVVIPFTRVVSNVANAMMDYTPIGAARAGNSLIRAKLNGSEMGGAHITAFGESTRQREINGEERERLLLRSVLGTAAASALYALSHDKDEDGKPTIEITGNGTGDVAKDAQLKAATGRVNNAIKYKGVWYSFSNIAPLAMVAGFVGNVNDGETYRKEKIHNDDAALDNVSKAAFQMLSGLGDVTAARGPRDLLQAMRTPDAFLAYLRRTTASTAQSAVPFSNLINETAGHFYENRKEAHTLAEAMQRNLPGARNSLNDAIDVLSDPLPATNPRLWNQVPVRDAQTERVWAALKKHSLFLSVPSKQMGGTLVVRPAKGGESPMTDAEFYAFMKERGTILKSMLLARLGDLEGDNKVAAETAVEQVTKMATQQAKVKVFGYGGLTTIDKLQRKRANEGAVGED